MPYALYRSACEILPSSQTGLERPALQTRRARTVRLRINVRLHLAAEEILKKYTVLQGGLPRSVLDADSAPESARRF
jgi:hypothetical protein